jgi:hypothetical protein
MTAIGVTEPKARGLAVMRLAATGAATLAVLYLACWLGTLINIAGSHAFITIFTTAPVGSVSALAIGLCWAIVFGGATGALAAFFYNAFGGSRP